MGWKRGHYPICLQKMIHYHDGEKGTIPAHTWSKEENAVYSSYTYNGSFVRKFNTCSSLNKPLTVKCLPLMTHTIISWLF